VAVEGAVAVVDISTYAPEHIRILHCSLDAGER